jgi:hypothetical protein
LTLIYVVTLVVTPHQKNIGARRVLG